MLSMLLKKLNCKNKVNQIPISQTQGVNYRKSQTIDTAGSFVSKFNWKWGFNSN
jgi:ethanolamine utilization protein EutP (predicted NTPase)